MNRSDPAMQRSVGTWIRRECLHLLAMTGHLWRVNFTVSADVSGRRFRIPILYGQGPQNLALLEPGIMAAFARLFALRAGTVFDVGVNVGQTLLKIKALDPQRAYVGFEINPRCCQYVEQLIAANRFPNCTIVPAGLSDRDGLATLFLRSNVSLDPSATAIAGVCDEPAALRRQYAAVCRGDDVANGLDLDTLAVVKIDTEGGELEVLNGLVGTVGRFRPVIICEVLPVGDVSVPAGRVRLDRQRAVQTLLGTWGYDIFRLHANAQLQAVDDIGVHNDLALSNYLFVPGEQRADVVATFETYAVTLPPAPAGVRTTSVATPR